MERPVTTRGALHGVHVVDLATVRSGPTAVRQLADLGADVVQVVSPEAPTDAATSSDYQNLHRSKRSIVLDLKGPRGHDALLRLVDRADVLVENYRPDVKHRLGIDYATLAERNPRLIYGSISGFGQDGPYRDRPGFDQIAQGLGGLMSITGPGGGGPWRVGIPVADLCAGIFLAQGLLAALFERERSGRGQWVQTSLLEAMVGMLDFQATRWLIDGVVPSQAGNDHPTSYPTGAFRTADGLINLAAAGDRIWRRLTELIAAPELADDPRFLRPDDRSRNRDQLRPILERHFGERPSAAWVTLLNDGGVPAGPVLTIDEVFADPQVRHLDLAVPVSAADGRDLRILRPPYRMSATPHPAPSGAPPPGRDTTAVLADLGFDAAS